MNSTSADFQNLYQALSPAPPAARMPWRWRLRIGAICTAIFICGYSGRWRSFDRGWSLRKGDRILLAWGNHPAFAKSFCRAGFGHRSGAVQHQA